MFLKNTWYVGAWAHEVPAGKLFTRTLLGVPVLFWRDSQDQVVAVRDRCPHRGAPLSKGRLEADGVRCMYHGMKFDRQGACIEIPGQERMPPGACVERFKVVQRHNWLWIWMGDEALADDSLIPDAYWLDSPEWRYIPDYMHYQVDYLLIADNLLDFSHLPFVHEKTLGGNSLDYAALRPEIERIDNGLKVSRWHMDAPPAPFVTNITGWTVNVDRWNIYDFLMPGVLLMDSGSAPAGSGARGGNRDEAVEFRSAQALTPETATTTHYFFSQAHSFSLDDRTVTEKLHDTLVAGFKEDWEIIHAQAATLALDPDFKMTPLNVDSALGYFRALMAKRISSEKSFSAAA